MKNLSLENIAKACNGTLFGGNETLEVEGVVTDSRQIHKNDLFLAVKGERVDGHKFIPQVMQAGAAAAVCEVAPENPTGPYILVKDVLMALQDIAAFYRGGLHIPIVGITGSVGKTSTKECIASVLSQKYCVLKTEGNFNNEIGVPLTLLKIREEHEVAVLEMGINHFGEMHRLGRMVKPDLMVYTNIGQCHLEFLGTRDGILKAKTEVFDEMNPDATVIINGDDDKLATIQEVHGKKTVVFGKSSKMEFYASQIQSCGLFGTRMMLHTPIGQTEISIPLPGEHMVYNALAAAATGCQLGLTLKEIADGIASVSPTGGRSHIIRTGKNVVIDDCYNANPVSMCAALDLLTLAEGRKVAIMGDMFELGENAGQMHAQVGEYAVTCGIDLIICVGEQSEYMADAARRAAAEQNRTDKNNVRYYRTKAELISELSGLIQPGDTVLVKASHGMEFPEIVTLLEENGRKSC